MNDAAVTAVASTRRPHCPESPQGPWGSESQLAATMVTFAMTHIPSKEALMSTVRRLVATSFAVAFMAGLAAAAPVAVTTASASNTTVVAIGPGCCK